VSDLGFDLRREGFEIFQRRTDPSERTDQPAEEMPERHDHGKNFSGTDRIKLCAKSLISQVYDLLARHTARAETSPLPRESKIYRLSFAKMLAGRRIRSAFFFDNVEDSVSLSTFQCFDFQGIKTHAVQERASPVSVPQQGEFHGAELVAAVDIRECKRPRVERCQRLRERRSSCQRFRH
jgi:hypothetical protein